MIYYTTLCKYLEEHPVGLQEVKTQYLYLLSHLTETYDLNVSLFFQQVMNISITGEIMVAYVVNENTKQDLIVGTGTVVYEPKIIHGARNIGHIEDIVVLPDYRGQGIADTLVGILMELAKDKDCYKVILDCQPGLCKVYEKSGLEKKGVQMAKYFT
jgi:glucosamine-phosphate N-acetyltransferase